MKKKREKIMIDGRKRTLIFAVLLVGIVILAALAVRSAQEKQWEIREENVLSYSFKNQAEYQVHLKPNPYIEKRTQGMNKAYIQKLVDSIQMQFLTSYEGDKKAQLSGEYQVNVFLRGYQMNEGEKEVIWERDIKEVENKKIKEKSASFYKKTEVTIVPADYDMYGELALQELDVSSSKEIVVEATGFLRVKKNGKTVKVPIEASVCIPMEQERYEIECTQNVDKVDSIVSKKRYQIGMDIRKILTYVAVLFFFCMAVIALVWKTEGDTGEIRKKRRKEKMLQAQLRKTIALTVFPEEMETAYKVKDIQGIFTLAEELRRPVFSQKVEEGIYFFVFDETKMYTFFESCI